MRSIPQSVFMSAELRVALDAFVAAAERTAAIAQLPVDDQRRYAELTENHLRSERELATT